MGNFLNEHVTFFSTLAWIEAQKTCFFLTSAQWVDLVYQNHIKLYELLNKSKAGKVV